MMEWHHVVILMRSESTERQYLVRNYTISIAASCEIWEAIIHINASLIKKGKLCLVFLPGKYEISDKRDWTRVV